MKTNKIMTIKGKIFACLFLAAVCYSGGLVTGYKLFNKPQTVNEVSIGKIKTKEGSNVDLDITESAETDNSKRKNKRRKKK